MSRAVVVPPDFDPVPSAGRAVLLEIAGPADADGAPGPDGTGALGVLVAETGEPSPRLRLDRAALARAGLHVEVFDRDDLVRLGCGGLFLEEFTGGRPWAHLDIAGTAQVDRADSWLTKGCSGFGARLLADLALGFRPPGDGPGAVRD